MDQVVGRAAARRALLERSAAAAEERKRRESANLGDLTTFLVEYGRVDGVDDWVAVQLAKVEAEAERRRVAHRAKAGAALAAMRLRGETVAAIAAQAGVSVAVVRGLLQAAAAGLADAEEVRR
jgi:hypothetical protein